MNFDVPPNLIFLSVMGSHAYGTFTPESDVDIRGVCIAPLSIRLSYQHHFEQYQGSGNIFKPVVPDSKYHNFNWDDCTVYDLVKAVELIATANPNMIELLFVEDDSILFSNSHWEKLREIRDAFLSKKIKHTFLGYAHAQAKKIKSHREWLLNPPKAKPERLDFGLPETSTIREDHQHEIQRQIDLVVRDWGMDETLEGAIGDVVRDKMRSFWGMVLQVPTQDLDSKLIEVAVKNSGIPDSTLDILKRERRYQTALKHWKSYLSWKEKRNPVRAELEAKHGYDTKHAMHLIRLARMGYEILSTGKVLVRRPDAEELIAIRRGAISFEKIEEMFNELELKIEEAVKTTNLPKSANHDLIDGLLFEILTQG